MTTDHLTTEKVSVAEAAKLLSVSPRKVREWYAIGELTGYQYPAARNADGQVVRRGQVWRIVNWAWFPNQRCQVDGQDAFADVSPDECEPIRTPRELWHRFRSGYEWWGTCWHGIHVSEALYPRDTGTPGGG